MDTVLLRTMTWKSKFTFGKYAGSTVEEVFSMGPLKLANIYYNYQTITFTDEILDAIPLFEKDRIKKPGINRAKFDKIMENRRTFLLGPIRARASQKAFERRKAKTALRKAKEAEYRTKGELQRMNVTGKHW